MVITSVITLGTLIAFLQYSHKLHDPFQNIVDLYIDIIKTSVALRRIFELLSRKTIDEDEPDTPDLSTAVEVIELRDVNKIYNHVKGLDSINHLSFLLKIEKRFYISFPKVYLD